MTNDRYIRNFSIIAHIDHGKSTLSDRLMELCGNIRRKSDNSPTLDSIDVEKRRGITIKAQSVRMNYKSLISQEPYILNLIDTPGHADFSYEVNRSLAACEGSLLVVDATQGVEAQTIANAQKALDLNHVLIPVINKIDVAHANVESTIRQIIDTVPIEIEPILISAKSGLNVSEILEGIVKYLPSPKIDPSNSPTRAMLIDSWYDRYVGVVLLVKVIGGSLKSGMEIRMVSTNSINTITEVGFMTPERISTYELKSGEIGYILANIKLLSACKVGDTIIESNFQNPLSLALPGFKEIIPVVFCTLFPINVSDFDKLKTSIEKLHLNDASFEFSQENSAMGVGIRCGFLGMLHMEVVKERLETEYNLELFVTRASVAYEVVTKTGQILEVKTASDMPSRDKISEILEPWARVNIITRVEYIGPIIQLCASKRGIEIESNQLDSKFILVYEMSLAEIVTDFYDRIKSCTSGYVSIDYEVIDKRPGDLVKLDILVNGDAVPQLSLVCHKNEVERLARSYCTKISKIVRRQMFKIIIQGSCNGKIIARETVSAFRKDVTAHCSGGDITRKKKLLEEQKRGKGKMQTLGSVHIKHEDIIKIMSDK